MGHSRRKPRIQSKLGSGHNVVSSSTSTVIGADGFFRHRYKLGLVVVLIGLAYILSLHGPFVFDDKFSIVNNPTIRSLWPLSQSMWGPQDSPTAGRPIPNFSFAVNFAIGGLRPLNYHAGNVALHLLNTLLVFSFVRIALAEAKQKSVAGTSAGLLSVVVTMLWGLHPLQTETVSYITQRTELWMAFFLLGTLCAAAKGITARSQASKIRWEIVAVALCALGMASKEVMFVAPMLVVFYDLAFTDLSLRRLIKQRGFLYLGLMSTWGILAAILATRPRTESVMWTSFYDSIEYLTLQSWAIVTYVRLALWPDALCADYGVLTSIDFGKWAPSMGLVLMTLGLTVWSWFRCRPLAFLGIWFFLLLAPTSSFLPIKTEPVAERRMYLPLLSISIIVTLLGDQLLQVVAKHRVADSKQPSTPSRWLSRSLIIGVAAILFFATAWRNTVYRSELAFWVDVVNKRPESARGQANVGIRWLELNQYGPAKDAFDHALRLEPYNQDCHFHLGKWHMLQQQPREALDYFENALRIDPNDDESAFYRAMMLDQLQRSSDAIEAFDDVLRRQPNNFGAHLMKGKLLASLGRNEEARTCLKRAQDLSPNSSEVRDALQAIEP